MADIQLRFHKDMLVLTAPLGPALESQGIDTVHDSELTLLLEPDTIEDLYRLQATSGAQCMVAFTETLVPARLRQTNMEQKAQVLADTALDIVRSFTPQHVIAAIGPCGLPLDRSSAASLKENRDQYAQAARLYAGQSLDALLLCGFASVADLKCALMGVRKVWDGPLFASVEVDGEGLLTAAAGGTLEEAFAAMEDLEADVAGFETVAPQEAACQLARRARAACNLPLMATLFAKEKNLRQQGPTEKNPYYCPDTMVYAADALRAAGVQFLRAAGPAATPAYTGALVAATVGMDAIAALTDEAKAIEFASDEALAALIAKTRSRMDAALNDFAADAALDSLDGEE